MKKIMKVMMLVCIAAFMVTNVNAQSAKKKAKLEYNSAYNYEVATIAVGVDGTKLVKVWGYGKKAEDAQRNAKRNAVACAIFKGYPAAGGGRAAATPAIATDRDAAEKNAEYFEKFFAVGGEYLNFVNLSTDAPPSGADRIKMKKQYKVGISASIAFDALRKEMEAQGIARSLDSGF